MHGKRGFTLVELITVIVIVGIVALIAAPRFFAQGYDARRIHDMALSAVRYGQKIAIAQHTSVYVVATASSVALCYDAGCASTVPGPAGGGAFSIAVPSGIMISAVAFSFNALGQPNPNNQINLSVTGDGATRQIVVEKDTGYVHD